MNETFIADINALVTLTQLAYESRNNGRKELSDRLENMNTIAERIKVQLEEEGE